VKRRKKCSRRLQRRLKNCHPLPLRPPCWSFADSGIVSHTLLILVTMATPRLRNCLHLFKSVSVCGNIRPLSPKWGKNCKIVRSNMSKSRAPCVCVCVCVCASDIRFDSLEEDVTVKQRLQSPNTWRWKQIWFPNSPVSLVEYRRKIKKFWKA